MGKISTPCIRCTNKSWEYIKPYLKKWGYDTTGVVSNLITEEPYLVINSKDNFGECGNYEIPSILEYNRVILTDVEKFLKRAAELKGFTYRREEIMKINGIEIKPGIAIYLEDENTEDLYIVFPVEKTLGVISYSKNYWWERLDKFLELYSNKIVRIDSSIMGPVLWKKPKEIVISMDEIAEKFGYPVESIKIKK